ncbi:MAG TPA: arginine repressor [Candidatus Latescibacteria bacterium]|nr:arginine repressor [Gemmatimonadota bacterium]HCR19553.1 arginine repressor [Candidatus Latescibacterota bacterium]|tara:strand:+ start:3207 stop:3671 length:465 start_codon:yes stop_codon:yes gene_type:complete
MTEKARRHEQILALIRQEAIGTQEDLAKSLQESGILTTQSTLSKDIKELQVSKVPTGDGGFRYRIPETRSSLSGRGLFQRKLVDFVVGIDGAENMLVLKTITGHAQGVCEALDQAEWPEIVGTIAGENTIFVLCRSSEHREELGKRIAAFKGEI